jgi:hypothetical protein
LRLKLVLPDNYMIHQLGDLYSVLEQMAYP